MFLTSLQDKVKRIQELRRSNAAQPVRNKKKYTRKIKHKNKFDQQPAAWPAKARGRACRYGCDQNHPGKLGQDWNMSVHSVILTTLPTKGQLMKLDEFKVLIESQRKAQQLTNLEKIAKIVNNTNTKKGKN